MRRPFKRNLYLETKRIEMRKIQKLLGILDDIYYGLERDPVRTAEAHRPQIENLAEIQEIVYKAMEEIVGWRDHPLSELDTAVENTVWELDRITDNIGKLKIEFSVEKPWNN